MIHYSLCVKGKVPSGKNNLIVTRTGLRFPRRIFAVWRDIAVLIARSEKNKQNIKTIDYPINCDIRYYPGDKRKRDVPGVIDSIFHVLEKAEIVTDDVLIGGYDKCLRFYQVHPVDCPRIEVDLYE